LVVGSSDHLSFIIDSGASRNMSSVKDLFTSLYSYSGPNIRMGDDSKIEAKGIGRIDIKYGYLNNVLFVPNLEVNVIIQKFIKFKKI